VKYAWGKRGTADTPLRDFEKEQKEVNEYNKALKEGRVNFVDYE